MEPQHLLTLILLAGYHATLSAAAFIPEPTLGPDAATAASLMRRAECPANMFQCPTSLGAAFSDVCCSTGQTCALDSSNNPACCPSGAVCTGTAPDANPTAAPSTEVSYVSNSYFSFPYAATTFDNSADCAAAVTACSENFDVCTANLGGDGGGAFGVTIEVPGGGGVTVDGSAQNLGASATSICSSLSSEACSALEATKCESFGDGSDVAAMHSPSRVVGAAILIAWTLALFLG